jgi:phage FluMu protein Com
MQRQKTLDEIEQERRDEEFARQLQDEMNDAERGRSDGYPIHTEVALQTVHVSCPGCHATNNIPRSSSHQSFRCGSCGIVLPSPNVPRGISLVTCQNCRCHNEIPIGATTQFMCGRCHRVLSFNQVQTHDVPLVPVSTSVSNPPVVLEGRVTKTIQVRCGQCQTINNVKTSHGTTEFCCMSCQATNEVDS